MDTQDVRTPPGFDFSSWFSCMSVNCMYMYVNVQHGIQSDSL